MKRNILVLYFIFIPFLCAIAQGKFCKHQSNNSLTPAERVYGLSKFWSTANSHFVFMDKVDSVVWDSIYQVVLNESITCNSDWEYYKLVEKLSAVLNDGHTGIFNLGFDPYTTDSIKPTDFFFPLRYHLFEEGVFIFREIENKIVLSQVSKSIEDELPLATELLEVNNLPIEEYIEKYTLPYVSQSTPHVRRSESIQLITRGICGEKLDLKFKKKMAPL